MLKNFPLLHTNSVQMLKVFPLLHTPNKFSPNPQALPSAAHPQQNSVQMLKVFPLLHTPNKIQSKCSRSSLCCTPPTKFSPNAQGLPSAAHPNNPLLVISYSFTFKRCTLPVVTRWTSGHCPEIFRDVFRQK